MDNHVSCFCDKKRLNPDDATLVLNGVPLCNMICLRLAEHAAKQKQERRKEGAWNGA